VRGELTFISCGAAKLAGRAHRQQARVDRLQRTVSFALAQGRNNELYDDPW
jgi:hypothetical protein